MKLNREETRTLRPVDLGKGLVVMVGVGIESGWYTLVFGVGRFFKVGESCP